MKGKVVTFGELLQEYYSQRGWGLSKKFKARRFVELNDDKAKVL